MSLYSGVHVNYVNETCLIFKSTFHTSDDKKVQVIEYLMVLDSTDTI